MWEEVKPITMLLEQEHDDGSRFYMYFYSYDYELVKLKEAVHFDADNRIIGNYSRLLSDHCMSEYDSNFFISRLTKSTTRKMIEYYENPNLFVEYMF